MKRTSVSVATMKELDRISIEKYRIPGIILMENAGLGTVFEITQRSYFQNLSRTFIFCGTGNNGGDGFVIARHLHNRNVPVTIAYTGDPKKEAKDSDAWINRRIILNMGLEIHEILDEKSAGQLLEGAGKNDLLIDALLGTGLKGEVQDPFRGIIRAINRFAGRVLAVDTPSGLDSDTGVVLGSCVKAEETFTYGLPKNGFFLNEGPHFAGKVTVVNISIPKGLVERALERGDLG